MTTSLDGKTCPDCDGDGEYRNVMLHLEKCSRCHGEGVISMQGDNQ